jgi:hypothetical protein
LSRDQKFRVTPTSFFFKEFGKEILTVWKWNFWQFEKGNFDSFKFSRRHTNVLRYTVWESLNYFIINFQGKCLAHLTFWFTIYSLLNSLAYFEIIGGRLSCELFGYVVPFSFMVFYCWINILAYDLSVTVRSKETVDGIGATKSYFKYYVFGYGLPTIVIICTFLFENLLVLWNFSSVLLGDICWWSYSEEAFVTRLFYTILPVAVLVLFASLNIVTTLVKFDRKKLSDEVLNKWVGTVFLQLMLISYNNNAHIFWLAEISFDFSSYSVGTAIAVQAILSYYVYLAAIFMDRFDGPWKDFTECYIFSQGILAH